MGGAWVDWPAADDPDRNERYRHMTNIPGCFNVGESDYQYHGANRLGANSLLSCIYGGLVTGDEVPRYLKTLPHSYHETSSEYFDENLKVEEDFKEDLMSRSGPENVHQLHDELAHLMVKNVTVKRNNQELKKTLEKIKELQKRYENISLDDHSRFANKTYVFANQFRSMLDLSLIIAKGALMRNEMRGAHYKPEYPNRDDTEWLKTTIAEFNPKKDEPVISYEDVDIRHLDPKGIQRDYTKAKKVKPTLENIPDNIKLPI